MIIGLIALGVTVASLAVVASRRSPSSEQVVSEGAHIQRLATIGTLSAEAAHEMKGPLSALLCLAEELEGSGVDPELVSTLREATTGMCRLTDDMGKLSRRASSEGICNMEDAVDSAVRMAAARLRGVTIVRWVTGLPSAAISGESLTQVMTNLLVNAGDALKGQHDGRVRITARIALGQLLLCVEDNGPGVDSSLAANIFEPFHTTKSTGEGTGLGLSISRDLLESVGGSLSMAPGVLGGACFAVRLPIAKAVELAA
jgi:two-component system C4-dicarboxylate transport sensor histidine kinase DctB